MENGQVALPRMATMNDPEGEQPLDLGLVWELAEPALRGLILSEHSAARYRFVLELEAPWNPAGGQVPGAPSASVPPGVELSTFENHRRGVKHIRLYRCIHKATRDAIGYREFSPSHRRQQLTWYYDIAQQRAALRRAAAAIGS